jgi:hypothetical protein
MLTVENRPWMVFTVYALLFEFRVIRGDYNKDEGGRMKDEIGKRTKT